jgi:hypothetical protein
VVWYWLFLRRGFPRFQANLSANQERFHGIAQVRKKVPAISNLCGLGRSQGGPIDIAASTISTHDIHFRVCRQPLPNALCLAVGQQIHYLVRLQVHEDAAEALATPPTPIVHPDDMHLANRRQRDEKERPEHGGIGKIHPQLVTQTFSALAAGGKSDLLHGRAQPLGQARGSCNEIREPLGEHFAATVRVPAKELADGEH